MDEIGRLAGAEKRSESSVAMERCGFPSPSPSPSPVRVIQLCVRQKRGRRDQKKLIYNRNSNLADSTRERNRLRLLVSSNHAPIWANLGAFGGNRSGRIK